MPRKPPKKRTRTPIPPLVMAEWKGLGYVTIDAAAEALGVARSTLYNTISSGRFPKGKMAVPGAPRPLLTYVKTPATLWVLQAAVGRVIQERLDRLHRKASRAIAAARPSAAALATGAAR